MAMRVSSSKLSSDFTGYPVNSCLIETPLHSVVLAFRVPFTWNTFDDVDF
uniref:Uncharacterized protein n=1 Tax=Peronospora matthiolae TaxID=2874970 RepID=A0AAV1U788_9STRA